MLESKETSTDNEEEFYNSDQEYSLYKPYIYKITKSTDINSQFILLGSCSNFSIEVFDQKILDLLSQCDGLIIEEEKSNQSKISSDEGYDTSDISSDESNEYETSSDEASQSGSLSDNSTENDTIYEKVSEMEWFNDYLSEKSQLFVHQVFFDNGIDEERANYMMSLHGPAFTGRIIDSLYISEIKSMNPYLVEDFKFQRKPVIELNSYHKNQEGYSVKNYSSSIPELAQDLNRYIEEYINYKEGYLNQEVKEDKDCSALDRNEDWIDVLNKLNNLDGKLMVVEASHLIGENNFLNALKDNGFLVEEMNVQGDNISWSDYVN